MGTLVPGNVSMDRFKIGFSLIKPWKNSHVSACIGCCKNSQITADKIFPGYDTTLRKSLGFCDGSVGNNNQIEAELGIGNGVIYRWRRQLQDEGVLAFPGKGNDRDKELAELRRELAEVREERDILRKAIAIFSDRRRK